MKVNIPENLHEVVSYENKSVPLFDNRFLDTFTRIPWFAVPIFYLPIVCYLIYLALFSLTMSWYMVLAYFVAGLFMWSFVEYIFHRFIFHYEPKSKLGKKFFFIIHGIHHAYPADSLRLVLPPAISIPLSYSFYLLFGLLFGALQKPIFAGFLFGYLAYDMIHYATHHANFIQNKWFVKMKQHHMMHHFKDPDNGFGVSSDLWDMILGTPLNLKKKKGSKSA